MQNQQIVLLGRDGPATRIIYHALREIFPDIQVILEDPVSRWKLLRGRLKRSGFLSVAGQVLFLLFIAPVLKYAGKSRIEAIKDAFTLNDSPITHNVFRVSSVNAEETRRLLREINPRLIVINGTRIIGKKTLRAVEAPFVNTHAGITPLYRGVHGGYWALAEGRPDLVGTTIHFVDEGIDTGKIIKQITFDVTPQDTFATYPYLHIATALPHLLKTVRNIADGRLEKEVSEPSLPSKLRFHPTFWEYLTRRVFEGVR